MVDFTQALNVKVAEIERPPLPPVGHYTFAVSKYSYDTIANGRFDVVDFMLKGVEAEEDVDPDDLKEFGGPGAINLRHRFMFNKGDDEESQAAFKRSLYGLKRFLTEHLQLDDEGEELGKLIDSSINARCIANVVHDPDREDPEVIYARIGKTAPAD